MALQTEETATEFTEQRVTDRRNLSFQTLVGALTRSRRRHGRRSGDQVNSYLDWYGYMPLFACVSIIVLCFADAFLTTILLSRGAVELNVFMDMLIQRDVQTFAIVKMGITGIALVILLMHFNFRIYKYISVRYVMYALVPMYTLLIAHELNMLANI